MKDDACVRFLRWALPRLRMRWPGFRKVRGQVCKRVQRRLQVLQLRDPESYRAYLLSHPQEWTVLDSLCRVTISRFYRDRRVYAGLEQEVLPALARRALARGEQDLRVWSAGCASGEEPYTLALLWTLRLSARFPGLGTRILATDTDADMLRRAGEACYQASSLTDLPAPWRETAFARQGGLYCLRPAYRRDVQFLQHDLRSGIPDGPFHLVLCRNLAFTYFDDALQAEVLRHLGGALMPGGALVIGIHETLPEGDELFVPWAGQRGVFSRRG